MTDVNGLDVLLAWVEFAVLAGGVLAVLLHRSGRHGDSRPSRHDGDKGQRRTRPRCGNARHAEPDGAGLRIMHVVRR